MGIPLLQGLTSAPMCSRQHLARRKRYPLVLMLEPLFRCNLACAGCGKIDYPDKILNQRLSVADCLAGDRRMRRAGGRPSPAASRCCTRRCRRSSRASSRASKFVILCTNALLLEKKLDQFKPQPVFTWSMHLDGDKEMHDKSVCQAGVYDRAVAAIKRAKAKGFRVNINCTLFNDAEPERVADFFDEVKAHRASTASRVSPGYAYERAPDQQHFLNRDKTKQLFRDIFRAASGGKNWPFSQSGLFLDFLAGNQTYHCTPWGNPTRTVFGWQRPCYLLGEGYAKTFKELMEDTDWDSYGTGNYEKCADCMVHCGFEATAVHRRGASIR